MILHLLAPWCCRASDPALTVNYQLRSPRLPPVTHPSTLACQVSFAKWPWLPPLLRNDTPACLMLQKPLQLVRMHGGHCSSAVNGRTRQIWRMEDSSHRSCNAFDRSKISCEIHCSLMPSPH
ncbi:hypothetical protein K443DRAFT_341005 [Laccaria amethystina LaAM-08-1]|uniref:Uncharacterized protein n=1 Tax=Laccaria amethystina LaAM-08-1 TaxID=1095629 RepID=A0A0C9X0Z6_9AGAR|nr:hypothetical protein K443DRAFT_341005 [Laccaria amethystina LaAM-08-1]